MGGVIVAIDPGDDTGWSRYDNRRLTSCGLVHPEQYPELPFIVGLLLEPFDLVIELPKDYSGNRQVDPNKLISLGRKVGIITGVFQAYYYLQDIQIKPALFWPHEWKGQIPKNIHHDREIPKLDPEEKTVLQKTLALVPAGKRHDVKDAVCLGLWRAKR